MSPVDENPLLPVTDGITVCKEREDYDEYGGRGRGNNVRTAQVGDRGWLGNPFPMEEDTERERARVIARFVPALYWRLAEDPEFKDAIKDLPGKRVACYCQAADETEPRCHLEVIDRFLQGGRAEVRSYLTKTLGAVPVEGGVEFVGERGNAIHDHETHQTVISGP